MQFIPDKKSGVVHMQNKNTKSNRQYRLQQWKYLHDEIHFLLCLIGC